MKTQVLKPGLLVSLKTSIRGGVNYQRTEIDPEHTDADGARIATWQTTREIADPLEFERATEARSRARSIVTAVCCPSSFGLLCPFNREAELAEAIAAARVITDAHNTTARQSHIEVCVLAGRIAQDDAEAVRAINSELRDLMDGMTAGIKAADSEAIREAANKARALGGMLTENVAGKVTDAIAQARRAAREIVKRVEKAGESAADVVKELNNDKIASARFAFLDLDDAPATVTQEAPSARPIELEPENNGARISASPQPQLALEV